MIAARNANSLRAKGQSARVKLPGVSRRFKRQLSLNSAGGGGESQPGACVVSPGCRLGIVGAHLLGCFHGNTLFRAEYRGRHTSAVNRWLIIAWQGGGNPVRSEINSVRGKERKAEAQVDFDRKVDPRAHVGSQQKL